LYGPKFAKNRPIDILFLTRYLGPIRQDALGPRFSTVDEISESYQLMSSFTEKTDDLKGSWTFEQWNKKGLDLLQ
jgi:hypothetical protein